MIFKDNILEFIVNKLCWRIVIALDFIADDLHFLVNLLLGIQAMEDDIRQHVDGLSEMFFRDGSIESRVFFVGKGIELTTQTL